ncbi:uncharacterized protein MELLADRAFT_109685 [Melampsora larici-populina 98AG31]|uniref:Uncharacterized protein n=1 Tax=Melampsora larici-populina (strain 98AG31 / pathotype 3-4-7) TaxID=747676 RepID=F4RXA5_MELLP|nr:uncharacterized protein MELLADRAFT_109685 [Melampsora larici-populina 98AG31]EGG02933.1 hypothetical protein MELLADRAFT_109685 [Melampsora larici-populina 98AG31]
MAVRAADILDLRSIVTQTFPQLRSQGEIYRHPHASHQASQRPAHHSLPSSSRNGPTPMDIDVNAVSTDQDGSNPFPAIRRICISKNLCFDCLKPYDDEHKRLQLTNGKRSCPNQSARIEDKLKMLRESVSNNCPGVRSSSVPTQISAVQLELSDYEALPNTIKEETTQLLESFWSTLHTPDYESTSNDLVDQNDSS